MSRITRRKFLGLVVALPRSWADSSASNEHITRPKLDHGRVHAPRSLSDSITGDTIAAEVLVHDQRTGAELVVSPATHVEESSSLRPIPFSQIKAPV